jgi:hypothetical protein
MFPLMYVCMHVLCMWVFMCVQVHMYAPTYMHMYVMYAWMPEVSFLRSYQTCHFFPKYLLFFKTMCVVCLLALKCQGQRKPGSPWSWSYKKLWASWRECRDWTGSFSKNIKCSLPLSHLYSPSTLFIETVALGPGALDLGLADWAVRPRCLSISAFPALGLHMCTTMPWTLFTGLC